MKKHVNLMKKLEKRDAKIKRLVIRFNTSKSPSVRRKLISILSPIIVQYPTYYKYRNKDFQHDFYVYIISKFDKLLSAYKPLTDCKFTTWFSLIMSRNLWNFNRIKKRKYSHQVEEKFINEGVQDKYFVAEDTVKYEQENHYDFFNTILKSNLSMKEKKILILKFSNACIAESEDPSLIKKMQRIEKIKQRINKNQFTIFQLQKQLAECTSEEKRSEIIKEIERIENYQKNKTKSLESFDICRSNAWIAKQLNIKTSTVSSLLMRAKKKLQERNAPIGLFPVVDNESNKI